MAIEIEVFRFEADVVNHPIDGRLADEHRAEDGLLGLDVLRRYPGGYFSSATIVLTEAIAPPATSTSIM